MGTCQIMITMFVKARQFESWEDYNLGSPILPTLHISFWKKVDIIHVDLTTDTWPVRSPLVCDLTSGKESSSEDKESISDSDFQLD